MRLILSVLLLISLEFSALAAPSSWWAEDSRKIGALTQELERISLTESQIAAVVRAVHMPFIEIWTRKVQENYSWLKEQGIANPGALIEKFPSMLGFSIKENLDAKVQWLTNVGVKNPSALIEKFPSVLGYSIEENLDAKVQWLQT